jgi:hypothetical protein
MTAANWYGVVDGAQDERLMALAQTCTHHVCLISGTLDTELAPALPWLVELRPGEQLLDIWRQEGAGRNWGIALQSPMDLQRVKLHLKKFLNAKLPDGTLAIFRFYDPRVLRTYMRAATSEEIPPWFSGVERYSVESDQPGRYHDFHFSGGILLDGTLPIVGMSA